MTVKINDHEIRDWDCCKLDHIIFGSFTEAGIYHVTEMMNPREPQVYPDGTPIMIRAHGLDGAVTQVQDIGPKQMHCIESMARRVVGALGYLGLVVAALVEFVVRIPFNLVVLTGLLICDDAFSFGDVLEVVTQQGNLAIDALVRCISGIVHKCILNSDNDYKLPMTFQNLRVC